MSTSETIGKITLLNLRLSFASLFETNKQDNDDGSVRETWKANFLIPKEGHEDVIAIYKGKRMPVREAIKQATADVKEKKYGTDQSKWPTIKPDRVFHRDGDLEDWDGYAGQTYISANANLTDRPSVVTNRKGGDGKWIPAEPGGNAAPYSGCYVNGVILVWCQDNKHGKRVNAMLKSVQFFKDGDAFGAGAVNPDDEFSDDMVGDEGSFEGGPDDADDGTAGLV